MGAVAVLVCCECTAEGLQEVLEQKITKVGLLKCFPWTLNAQSYRNIIHQPPVQTLGVHDN